MRPGAVAWVLTLQFFLAEYVVERQWTRPYDRNTYYISDLGALGCFVSADGRGVCSPWHAVMNTSFVLQGVLIVLGALLLRSLGSRRTARAATALLLLAGVGVALVGLFPEDSVHAVHYAGAAVNFAAGNAGLVLLGLSLRARRGLRTAALWSILVGGVGLAGLLLLAVGIDLRLGIGGLERVVAYPLPLALSVVGVAVLVADRRQERTFRPG